jgi:hypothetical protein
LHGLSLFAPVQSSPGLLNEGDNLPPRGSERRLASVYAWSVEHKPVLLDREGSLKA